MFAMIHLLTDRKPYVGYNFKCRHRVEGLLKVTGSHVP